MMTNKERFKRIARTLRKRAALLVVLLAVAGGLLFASTWWGKSADASGYMTAKAERGSVEVAVTATGTVQAVTTVEVGSQVSGTIAWIGADYNSDVKRGQVIARLDPSIIQAQVENARANVLNAEAAVQAAETDVANQRASLAAAKANEEVARVQRDDAIDAAQRNQELQNIIASREIQKTQAEANVAAARYQQVVAQTRQAEASVQYANARLAQARAQLAQARAQLEQQSVNLNNTVITSPIDGVVVSRSVDVGQTVAASLQAPTLFTIANDLTKMQVLASIDEADVGQVREGSEARFTVDAFPNDSFEGRISQIRLEAVATQNVVTYTAVIDVDNPELKLRPGMTANIVIPVSRADNALLVPNAALRFQPQLSEEQQTALREQMAARRAEREASGEARHGEADGAPQQRGQTVWVTVGENKIEPRRVRTGITDGRMTEVVAGDLREGETLVIGQNGADADREQPQARSPFAPRMGGGRGGRR